MARKMFSSLRTAAGYAMFGSAVAFLFAVAVSIIPGGAQESSASAAPYDVNETITVHAPYFIMKRTPVSGRKHGFANAEVISLSRVVNYADLDLSKDSGTAELQKRISQTARDVCHELNRRYPEGTPRMFVEKDCIKKAIDDAMVVAKQTVAATG